MVLSSTIMPHFLCCILRSFLIENDAILFLFFLYFIFFTHGSSRGLIYRGGGHTETYKYYSIKITLQNTTNR